MFQKNNIILLVFFLGLIGSIKAQNLVGSSVDQQTLQASIYVNEGPGQFYYYQVFSNSGNIMVNIVDQNLNNYSLPFDKQNNLYFRAAYQKFIIVEEKNETDTLNYWILQINQTQTRFDLKSFSVNSRVDNQGYHLDNDYLLASIIEYNQFDNFLYVIMENFNDTDIYGFDLANQGSPIKIINWLHIDELNPHVIAGGNSKVLVEATNDQLWIDTRNIRQDTTSDPTIYNKTDIKDLTQLPIYTGGSKVFNLLNSYFQYVSESQDLLNMTFFVYHGYGDQPIQSQVNLVSTQKIMTFSDGYNYFLAVGDQDAYFTIVDWNQTTQNYSIYSNTFQKIKTDDNALADAIKVIRSAIQIVYNDGKLYVLTADKFYVYGGDKELYQIELSEPITSTSNVVDVMFVEIKAYLSPK